MGRLISSPIDTVNLFGSLVVTTSPAYTVTSPTQPSASATAGQYVDNPYSFTYDGALISGDSLAVVASYTHAATSSDSGIATVQGLYNSASSPSSAQILTIPLVRFELPQANNPIGATFGGSVFDSSNSWYYIAPANALNNQSSASLVFNYGATTAFTLNVAATNDTAAATVNTSASTACAAADYTVGTPTTTGNLTTTPISIDYPSHSGQTTGCTLTVVAGGFPSLKQTLAIYPTPGAIAVGIQGVARRL